MKDIFESLPEAIRYDGHEEGIPALIITDASDNSVKQSHKKIFMLMVIAISLLAVVGIFYIVFTNYLVGMEEKKALEQKLFQDSLSSAYRKQSEPLAINSVKTEMEIGSFVRSFYQSLELTEGENQRAYNSENFKFDKSLFLSMTDSNAVYSLKRIENLTDQNHDKYQISLVDIDTIYTVSDKLFAKTKVSYSMYELGEFINSEQLELISKNNQLKLTRWSDLQVLEFNTSGYEGTENIKKTDFYSIMGKVLP